MVSGISVTMIFKVMLDNMFGIVPYFLSFVGIKSNFFGSYTAAMPTIIGLDIWWQTSFVFIIILAGLKSIPNEPIEAARMDGASEWEITRHIRLPMIRSLLFLVLIFRSIDTLKVFDIVWGTTAGGPGLATEVLQTYAYRVAFSFLEMSKSMTVMVLFSIVVIRGGNVNYIGWAIPESVFIDYEIIQSAPSIFNYSGIGDVLCFYTGVLDWQFANKKNKCEKKWEYNSDLATESLKYVDDLLANIEHVKTMNEKGIDTIIRAHFIDIRKNNETKDISYNDGTITRNKIWIGLCHIKETDDLGYG